MPLLLIFGLLRYACSPRLNILVNKLTRQLVFFLYHRYQHFNYYSTRRTETLVNKSTRQLPNNLYHLSINISTIKPAAQKPLSTRQPRKARQPVFPFSTLSPLSTFQLLLNLPHRNTCQLVNVLTRQLPNNLLNQQNPPDFYLAINI